ncbi:hypothetical protein [Adlercreutzia mucosicola]|uniref:hypothetical protein n=1 Tax=Adlercreutzia mucosicola TaxID=580026 RepID=UPI0004056CE8|nr:hypothetical protein [Adlercreutzia mucosicola]MCR2034128.1 hypothetical protein [Adlercreutzia mucosicola]
MNLAQDSAFWRMRPETMGLIVSALSAERRDAVWPRLLAPMCSMVRGSGKLGELETEWLDQWLLYEAGRGDLCPQDVQTVQMSIADAALALGYGSAPVADVVAVRAIRALREIGVLRLVHKGIKGHSSLYAVMPLPPLQSD